MDCVYIPLSYIMGLYIYHGKTCKWLVKFPFFVIKCLTFFLNTCVYILGLTSPDSYLNLDRSSDKRHKKKKRRKGKKGNFTDQHFWNKCGGLNKLETDRIFLHVLILEINDNTHIKWPVEVDFGKYMQFCFLRVCVYLLSVYVCFRWTSWTLEIRQCKCQIMLLMNIINNN